MHGASTGSHEPPVSPLAPASPTLAVGEDEEGGEPGGEGYQGEDEQGLEDLETELQEEQHQGQSHRRGHRDGDPLRGAQGGEHGWRGVGRSGRQFVGPSDCQIVVVPAGVAAGVLATPDLRSTSAP